MTSFAEFQEFNAELAALIRAGVPVESGLGALESQDGRGLATLSQRIQTRLTEGRTLIDALRQEEGHFSEAYVATVEAALRADQLPAALESLAQFGRTTESIRQQIRIALLYPKIVVVMAYILFATLLRFSFGRWFQVLHEEYGYQMTGFAGLLDWLWRLPNVWFLVIPVVIWVLLTIVVGFVSRLFAGSHAAGLSNRELMRRGFWLPGVAKVYDLLASSQVCGLLGLLVRHNVPLAEALPLVGRAATSGRFANGLIAMAGAVQSGRSMKEAVAVADLPWLLRETLLTLGGSTQLADGLDQAAAVYQRRAVRQADLVQRYAPVVLTVFVGGGIVLVYALSVIIPFRTMIQDVMSNWS